MSNPTEYSSMDRLNEIMVEINDDTPELIREEKGVSLYRIGGREVKVWHEEALGANGTTGDCFRIQKFSGEPESVDFIQYGIVLPVDATISLREYTLQVAQKRVREINSDTAYYPDASK